MISLPDFKKLLGSYAESLTDEQVKRLRDMEYQIADVIFDQWLSRRNEQLKQQLGFNTSLQHNAVTEDTDKHPITQTLSEDPHL